MAVELVADVDISSNQSIKATVYDEEGKSETIDLLNGEWEYYLVNIAGDPDANYEIECSITGDKKTTPTIHSIEVNIPGEHYPIEAKEIGAEVEWSDHAIDDGSMTDTLDNYDVEIVSVGGDGRRFSPTSLSYSPAVNASKDLSLNTPHFEWLKGEKFLGSQITVYANDEVIYKGEVKRINLNRNHDEFSIETKSFGKKLLGKSIDIKAKTGSATDAIADLVDQANTIHSDYEDKLNTDDEELNNVVRTGTDPEDGIKLNSSSTGGYAKYYNVGDSALDLNPLYVKAYTSDTIDVIIDDGKNTYTETLPIYDDNEFGKWFIIEPDNLDDAWYSIRIEFSEDQSKVYDWRAIKNRDIKRIVEPPDTSSGKVGADLYDYTTDGVNKGLSSVTDTNKVIETGNGYRPRQKCAWHVGLSGDPGTVSTSMDAVDGACYTNSDYTQYDLDKMNFNDTFPYWEVWARVALLTDNGVGEAYYDIIVNGDATPHTLTSDDYDSSNFSWVKVSDYTMSDSWSQILNETNDIDFRGETNGHGDEVGFGEFCVIVGDHSDSDAVSYNYDFASGLTNGHVDTPRRYDQGYVEFEETPIDGSLTEATVNADFDSTSNVQYGWGPIHSTNPLDLDSSNIPNSDTNTKNFDGGHTHTTRVYLSGSRLRDNSTPRLGYYPQTLSGIDVNGDYNDLSHIYERDLKGNILSQINSIAGDTTAMFRFEGDTIRIFERKQLWTDPDLQAIDISSSASIEGVFESCEVIGLNGVSSGIIEVEDAPDYVDDHKEIRDQSITTKRGAVAKAHSFLEKHGEVEYTGSMETLPTFAPLGEFIDGEHFSHGQPMEIRSVSYSKDRASIDLGYAKNIANELLAIKEETTDTTDRVTEL